MAESSSSKQTARSSEHFGQARSRRNNLSLEIRVENADSRGPKRAGVGRSESKPSSPSSPETGLNKEQRHGSLKIRKGAILHHFLHPLDYYHERKKSRSSTSSINSDASSDTGRWNAFAKSHPDSVSTCPGPYRNSSPMWPIVKRKAKSASSPSGSPRVSPLVSPSLYSSISHSTDIYNPPSKHGDGPASRLRKFGRQISNPGGAYGDRRSVSPPNKTSNHSRYGKSPPNRINPLLLVNPIPKEWRPTHRRSLSDGNARDDDVLSSSSSSVSSSLSTSESDSDTGSSASSSSHSSGRGKHTGHHNHHANHGHHANDKKPKAHSYHAHPRTNSSSLGSDKPIKERAISVLNNDYTACSPGGTPVNKFLLSVVLQDCNGVPLPVGHSAEVPVPNPVTRSDNEDDVFGKHGSGPVRRRKKGSKRHGEKRAASRTQSESIDRTSSVEKLYSVYEEIIKEGQLHRRHSMDPDRRRHGSGGFGATYIRGDDPNQAAIIFRDCRGLPAAAPFLENFKRSELEENESQILVKFFKYHHTYDLIPTSAKLVIFDTRLQVKKAFYALVYNGVRAAPLWDSTRQEFVGMLTITDFIRILQSFYNSPNRKMEELEDHRLEMWRTLLKDDGRKLISIAPNECLYDAIRSLIHQKIHRLPVIDPITGNVLYIITHKRILKFLYLYINELPKPSVLQKSLRELDIGTYDNIETARGETQIIEALNKFVERRISALPIVDDEGKLIDIYAKFDVINLAAEGTYHNLDVTLHQANEYRNEWFEGVLKCDLDETLGVVMERIVRAEVHRLVVVDKNNKVIGIISLSDILNELVLKPCNDDPVSMRNRTIAHMEAALSGDIPSPEKSGAESQSSDLGEIQNCTSTADDDWGGTSDMSAISVSEEKLQERKSSAESEDNFDLEVNKIPDSIAQQGVISISS